MKLLMAGLALVWTCAVFGSPGKAHAQDTKTWISGVGDDVNPCSRTAPCKTFAGAISKTQAGGEITCLDPGGFGAVTITKAITLNCKAGDGGILATSPAVTINTVTNPNAAVTLIGLVMKGVGQAGEVGVRVIAAGHVTVRDSRISSHGVAGSANGYGIWINNNVPVTVDVVDTIVTGAANGGILVQPQSNSTAKVTLQNVSSDHNLYGLRAQDGAKVSAIGSSFAANTNNGVLAVSSSGGAAEVLLTNSAVAGNGINGVATSGAAATVRLQGVTIAANGLGVNASNGGTIATTAPATNYVRNNTTDGATNAAETLR